MVAIAMALAIWPVIRSNQPLSGSANAASGRDADPLVITASTTGDRLHIRFVRPNGAAGDLELERGADGTGWSPGEKVDAPGVVLGDGYPVFASPRFLAVMGLDPRQAIRPMSEALATESAEEVTVIRGWGGEVAICLWRDDKIVRAFLVGEIFDRMLDGSADRRACARLEELASSPTASSSRTSALAASLAGCPTTRSVAIERLMRNCEAGDASACDLLLARAGSASDLWPEVDDLWRWILDMLDAQAEPSIVHPAHASPPK